MKEKRKAYEQKLADKLKELKTAGDKAWKLAKAGTEEIWTRAKAAYENADSKSK
jgi:hypothetical protein